MLIGTVIILDPRLAEQSPSFNIVSAKKVRSDLARNTSDQRESSQ